MNTVLSDQQPRVSFLHYEELRALEKFEEKIHLWRSFFLVSSSLDPSRRTFSDRDGGGVRTHRTPPAYAPGFWFYFTVTPLYPSKNQLYIF